MDKGQVIINVDLTTKGDIELSPVNSADLMYVRAFATHEGTNANGIRFRRETLLKSYKTFIDKPVIMVADRNNLPTGHGYSYTTKTFDESKRKYIGHITNAFPVIVNEDGGITTIAESMDENEFPEGELRICVDFVVYKYYLNEIAERLQFLHDIGDFNFSMESKTFGNTEKDGVRDCEDILFTGLCVVARPAFEHSQSITVAEEEKEEHLMDFEKMYNDLKADYDTLVASTQDNEKISNELAETKVELADVKGQLAEANATIETLKPYKEKVEVAEKKALGEERAAKLKKFGVENVDVAELAEKSVNEFADMLCEAADKMVVEVAETKEDEVLGIVTSKTNMSSDKDKLVAIFKDFE